MRAEVDVKRLTEIVEESERLKARVCELLENNTKLVERRRSIDRQSMVRQFFRIAEQDMPETPGVPSDEVVRFRLRLVAEEFFEMLRACLVDRLPDGDGVGHSECALACAHSVVMTAIADDAIEVDMPELADATVDLDYVVEGFRIALGIDSDPLWIKVHEANIKKLGGPKRESDGKQLKPEGWAPPDIEGELRRQASRGGTASSEGHLRTQSRHCADALSSEKSEGR